MTILLTLMTSKVGGYLALGLGALVAASLGLLRAFNAGKRSEQGTQKTAQLDAVQQRKSVDEDVSRLDDNSIRQRLHDRWGR